MNDRAQKALQILESATPLLMEGYARIPGADPTRRAMLGTSAKTSAKDLVTLFDKRVETFLKEKLSAAFPGEALVGEESVAGAGQNVRKVCEGHERYWLIDPIDGTTNYSRAYPFFCSTIAFVERSPQGRHRPLLGLVWNPLSHEMFWAERGGGAWLNRERLATTQISKPVESLLTTGFASERAAKGNRAFDLFRDLTKETLGVRRDGSAALDLAYVAAGRTDAYWEWGLAPWDTAAGILLVEEAGGRTSHHDGSEIDLLSGEIAASNGTLHDWLVTRLKSQ